MDKKLIYAGYVAVGALVVYLLLKKDKKKPVDASNVTNGKEGNYIIGQPPRKESNYLRPKPNVHSDGYVKTLTNEELIKTAIDNKCQSGGMYNLLQNKLYENAVAEIRRRGLDLSVVNNHRCTRDVFVGKNGIEHLPQ